MHSVAKQLACPKPTKADVLGTTAGLDCGDANRLRIESFAYTKARDEALKAVADSGLIGPLVHVDSVVIECPDEATAKSVADKVGGSVE